MTSRAGVGNNSQAQLEGCIAIRDLYWARGESVPQAIAK